MKDMREMTIRNLLTLNILVERGICGTMNEALCCTGQELQLADRIAEKIIQGIARSTAMLTGKANLYAGTENVPYKKQNSLRILRRDIRPEDILAGMSYAYYAERGRTPEGISGDFLKISEEEAEKLFRYLKPMISVLGIEISEAEILEQFRVESMFDSVINDVEGWNDL